MFGNAPSQDGNLTDSGCSRRCVRPSGDIEEAERVQLSGRDSLMVLNLLENLPTPNAILRAAIEALPKPKPKRK